MKKIRLLLVFCALILMTGCSTKGGNVPKNEKDLEKLKQNIIASTQIVKIDGRPEIFLTTKNNNRESVTFEVDVEYFDSNNNFVGSDSVNYYDVPAGYETTAVVGIDVPSVTTNIKTYVKVEDYSLYKSCINRISQINVNKVNDNIIVQYKNNSDTEINHVTATMIFYNNGTIVGYSWEYVYDIASDRTINMEFREPYKKKYTDYKMFINECDIRAY